MASRRDLLRELVSHDGLKDSLTGLLAFPAFIESAKREIHSTERNKTNLNLYLVSITETNASGERVHIARIEREIADRHDDELYALAARVTQLSHVMKNQLRANDLMTRYTFAEFLILNSGNTSEITKKLTKIVNTFDAAVVGLEMISMQSDFSETKLDVNVPRNMAVPPETSTNNSLLESAISTLEEEMSALLVSRKTLAD